MSYPNRRFRGTVQGIGWAILSEDARTEGVLPAVKPSLNWARLARRIPVRIQLEAPDPERPYRMGMTAVVTIRGDRDGPR
jgi:multidrug resistance efflux pump